MAGILLGQGANAEREKSFLAAAQWGQLNFVCAHLEDGVSVEAADEDQRRAMHVAAINGDMPLLRELHSRGAEADPQDKHGMTPLLDAIGNPQADAAHYLLERMKADAERVDCSGHGVVRIASTRQPIIGEQNLMLAMRYAKNIDMPDSEGKSPLEAVLMQRGNAQAAVLLLLGGADPHYRNPRSGAVLSNGISDGSNSGIVILPMRPFLQLPPVPDDLAGLTHDALVEPNGHKARLLDNPRLWRRMPEVLEVLKAKGEPLPNREELTSGGVMGYPPMALAVLAGQYDALEKCLTSHGDRIRGSDFAQEHFCDAALGSRVLQDQIRTERWAGKAQELKQFYNELPDKARDTISNYQQVYARVSSAVSAEARGRGR